MSKILNLDEALDFGLKCAEKNGVEAFEGYSNTSQAINIGIEKKIPNITSGISSGISFRVVANNNQGFGFTKTLTDERIESTIKIAIQNAKSKGKDKYFKSLPYPSKKTVVKFEFDKELTNITSDFLAEQMKLLISNINDTKGLHFLSAQSFLSIQNEHLINSNGIDIKSKGSGIGGYSAAITTKGLIPNYSFAIKGGPKASNFSFYELGMETISQTLRAANPKTMNFNSEVPIILEPEASLGLFGGLFTLLSNQLVGDAVSSGATPYSDQVGNQIASESLTFIDNGLNPNKVSSSSYDGEGVPQEKTILIDKGILKTFLLDTYYAHKLGLESNGKCSRFGIFGFGGDPIKRYPSIGPTSLEISPGDSSKDEMIAETTEGFMLRSLMGLHMSDRSSGRFSVTGFGWYIKNGEIKNPVQGVSISGMLPDLIKKIDLISKETESLLSAEAPYIRFSKVTTTAKKFDFKTKLGLTLLKVISIVTKKHPMF